MPRSLLLLASLALSVAATAQITYIDADTSTNTTLADGTAYTPQTSTSGTDNEWSLRAFGNGATMLTTHDVGGSTEDAPMLRVRISGLIPTLPYHIYSYGWSDGGSWRHRAQVDTAQPAAPITGWNTVHFQTSTFLPTQPLTFDAVVGFGQSTLGLNYDAAGLETDGHFTTPVMVHEGNRSMYEAWLGVYTADQNGDLDIYVDDLEGSQGSGNRTWFDGVGYEIAPFVYGNGCGNPQPQIGYTGAPIANTTFSCDLHSAPPGMVALCITGFSNSQWSGVPLPFDLGLLGLTPSCPLNVSLDVLNVAITDANGDAVIALSIPGGAVATPATIYWQWGVLTPTDEQMSQLLETTFHR